MYSGRVLSLINVVVLLILSGAAPPYVAKDVGFDLNYRITWGNDHVISLNQGKEIQLSLDRSSGAGFASKASYGSGFFYLKIKLPDKDSAGVVTAFYLISDTNKHDELDFEFLGNREGKPYTLQTNVFVNGVGNREQRTLPWFDPTEDFHAYQLLWNQHQIVFYVDNVPIRVFKNNTNVGVGYPSKTLQIEASLWDGDSWATDGGETKTNWAHAPFVAHFQGFNVDACPSININNSDNSVQPQCYSSSNNNNYWWNSEKFWKLNGHQQKAYEAVREKYMNYDYCADRPRYSVPPPECTA